MRSLALDLLSQNERWQELGEKTRRLRELREEISVHEEEFRAFAAAATLEATEHVKVLADALQVFSRSLDTSRLVDFCQLLGGRHERHSAQLMKARKALEEQESLVASKQLQTALEQLLVDFRVTLLQEPWAQALVCQICLEPLSVIVDPKLACHDPTTYLAHIRSPCRSSVCIYCWHKIMGFDAAFPTGRVKCPICRSDASAPMRRSEAWSVNAPLLRMADDCLHREIKAFNETFGTPPSILRCLWCGEEKAGLWALYKHVSECVVPERNPQL